MEYLDHYLNSEGVSYTLDELWEDPERQRLGALCYLEVNGEILLIQRKSEPFTGFWTAPGGKLEPGEDPRQAVVREVQEEANLTLTNPRLQLITSEKGATADYNWLLFVFRASAYTGKLQESSEGILSWVPREQLLKIKNPEVDRQLFPYIFSPKRWYIRLSYNHSHLVAGLEVLPLDREL